MTEHDSPYDVYNIRAGLPFSKTLARYLMDITQEAPERLTQYRVLLPTRRACRILRETFLSLNDGRPLLLPQMTPLGDVDEEDLSLMMFGNAGGFLDVPEAIPPLKRQLLLAKLIRSVPEFVQGPDHALALSKALCQFIDQVVVEELSFADLHKIVPEEFAQHWQITLGFLKIISEHWPKILAEEGLIDVAERRNLLLQALSEHWKNHPPDYPVIAAGSTGSIPAAGRLLSVIARMPTGSIILPGLDMTMDGESWGHVGESHPQHGLKTLLSRIGAQRSDVKPLVPEKPSDTVPRHILASEMMLPAQVTARWKKFGKRVDIDGMTRGLRYFSCTTQQEEAGVIALLMRESLQEQETVTALVTPDRTLARRVSALCRRWGIEVDDSAGLKLLESRLGKFISLSMSVARQYDPVTLLALMKISLCRFGQKESLYNRLVEMLETDIMRQGDVIGSHEMLRKTVAQKDSAEDITAFLDAFYAALEPLRKYAGSSDTVAFSTLLRAHLTMMERLAETQDAKGDEVLWRGDVGEAAALFFTDLTEQAAYVEDITLTEYEAIITALLQGITVRSAYGVHPRLLILGQLEARLADADLVILGGLNEGVWPPDSGHDPWMSRPMRAAFGLPGSEQAIGIAAHDFVQGFCAPNVVMTRAEKVEGSPTVPARWLSRLDTVLKACGRTLSDYNKGDYQHWVEALDAHDVLAPYQRPAPTPPVSARPKAASVTKIETWMQNPYAIYMHYVLRLRKMHPLKQDNDAALRGTILHEILDRFTHRYPLDLPEEAEDKFLEIARDVFTEILESPDALRYWWPKIIQIATWFVAHEQNWRSRAKFLESEVQGHVDIDVDGMPFTLHGTADRIDRMHGGCALIDYKTGGSFSSNKLKKGEAPQLPLEALMIERGGFSKPGLSPTRRQEDKKGVPPMAATYLGYWMIKGGKKPGEIVAVEGDLSETVEIVLEGLKNLITVFRDEQTPFYAVPDTANAPRFNDYEHVSRLKEWAALDDDGNGEAA